MVFARPVRPAYGWPPVLIQRRSLILLMTAAYLCGGVAGGIATGFLEAYTADALQAYLLDSLTQMAAVGADYPDWQQVVLDSALKPAGLMWLLGLTVAGMPLIAAVVFMHGYVLGFSLVYMINVLAWRGIPLACVALLPQRVLLVPGLILAATSAAAFSLGALRIVLGRPGTRDIFQHLRTEGAVALTGCLLLLLGGLCGAYITPGMTAFVCRLLL